MATNKRRDQDVHVRKIREVLMREYGGAHSQAQVDVKRCNSVAVHVRVIDPDFQGKSWSKRDAEIWKVLDQLPEETESEVSMLLLFTPKEAKTSIMNVAFEDGTLSLA